MFSMPAHIEQLIIKYQIALDSAVTLQKQVQPDDSSARYSNLASDIAYLRDVIQGLKDFC
jgi:chromatin remodeling complex protein RSC6